jgi:hypothetical protein
MYKWTVINRFYRWLDKTANRIPLYIYIYTNNNILNDIVLVHLIYDFYFEFNGIDLYSQNNNNNNILKLCYILKPSNYLKNNQNYLK